MSVIDSTSFDGTANNALYLGGLAANTYALKASPSFTGNVAISALSANGSLGTSGQLLTSNGSGIYWGVAGGPSLTATAKGSITNGAPIVVNLDGTVSQIKFTDQSTQSGTTTFVNSTTSSVRVVYDIGNDKFVIAFGDNTNSGYGTVIVASVSGNTVTYGTKVAFNSSSTNEIDMIYDSVSGKVIIAYRDVGNSNKGTAIVGTVSGLSMTFGTPTVFSQSNTVYTSMTYHTGQQKVVIAYRNNADTYAYVIAGTVSGTSISFGTALQLTSTATSWIAITYSSQLQYIHILYTDDGDSSKGKCQTASLSGTTFTVGQIVATFNSQATDRKAAAYDPNTNTVACVYGDSSQYEIVFGTPYLEIYGPHISFGSTNGGMFPSSSPSSQMIYDPKARAFNHVTKQSATYGYAGMFKKGATGVAYGPAIQYNATNLQNGYGGIAVNPTTGFTLVVWAYSNDFGQGTAGRVFWWQTVDYNFYSSTSYIGISDGNYANGATATVQINGAVDDAQTGLTPGQRYWVNYQANLTTSDTGTEFFPSAYMGLGVGATKMIVKG